MLREERRGEGDRPSRYRYYFESYKVHNSLFPLKSIVPLPEYQTHGFKYISKISIMSFAKLLF